jgi:hypothetical protein
MYQPPPADIMPQFKKGALFLAACMLAAIATVLAVPIWYGYTSETLFSMILAVLGFGTAWWLLSRGAGLFRWVASLACFNTVVRGLLRLEEYLASGDGAVLICIVVVQALVGASLLLSRSIRHYVRWAPTVRRARRAGPDQP